MNKMTGVIAGQKSRENLIARAEKIKREVLQIFNDIEHWNNSHPSDESIHPDPDGSLGKTLNAVDLFLRKADASQPTRGRE